VSLAVNCFGRFPEWSAGVSFESRPATVDCSGGYTISADRTLGSESAWANQAWIAYPERDISIGIFSDVGLGIAPCTMDTDTRYAIAIRTDAYNAAVLSHELLHVLGFSENEPAMTGHGMAVPSGWSARIQAKAKWFQIVTHRIDDGVTAIDLAPTIAFALGIAGTRAIRNLRGRLHGRPLRQYDDAVLVHRGPFSVCHRFGRKSQGQCLLLRPSPHAYSLLFLDTLVVSTLECIKRDVMDRRLVLLCYGTKADSRCSILR